VQHVHVQAFYVDCTFVADEALHAAEGVAWSGVAIPAETEQMLTLLTKPPAG
jgi:hypothetical protein